MSLLLDTLQKPVWLLFKRRKSSFFFEYWGTSRSLLYMLADKFIISISSFLFPLSISSFKSFSMEYKSRAKLPAISIWSSANHYYVFQSTWACATLLQSPTIRKSVYALLWSFGNSLELLFFCCALTDSSKIFKCRRASFRRYIFRLVVVGTSSILFIPGQVGTTLIFLENLVNRNVKILKTENHALLNLLI